MNNQQLQAAIDKAREFLAITGTPSGPLWEARVNTKKTLQELEQIQVIRAGLITSKQVKP